MSNMVMEARVETLEKCVQSLRSEIKWRRLDGKIEEKLDKITEMLASLLRSGERDQAAAAAAGHKNGGEFPCFDGGDPAAWIFRAERYFHAQSTEEAAKVEVALGGMDGAALNWAEWVAGRRPGISWKELSDAVLCVYGEKPCGGTVSPLEELLGTKQTGSVDEYLNAFVSRALHVKGLSDSHCLAVFLHGLHQDIRARIRSQDAKDILSTMYFARQIERELLLFTHPQPQPQPQGD